MATGVEGSGQVRVYLVKKAERGEVYKKKVSWMLRELKQVDGRDRKNVRTVLILPHLTYHASITQV